MKNYIHDMDDFSELFEKIDYKERNLGVPYIAMMIKIDEKDKVKKFGEFLLEYLKKSDTIFHFSKTKYLIIFEETAIRGAIMIDKKFRNKIKKHGCSCKFYSAAIQGYSVENEKSLEKALKKRLKKAKSCKDTDFIHSLSNMNKVPD